MIIGYKVVTKSRESYCSILDSNLISNLSLKYKKRSIIRANIMTNGIMFFLSLSDLVHFINTSVKSYYISYLNRKELPKSFTVLKKELEEKSDFTIIRIVVTKYSTNVKILHYLSDINIFCSLLKKFGSEGLVMKDDSLTYFDAPRGTCATKDEIYVID